MSEVIFLTGGSGFVGTAIARALISAGHQVRALARSKQSAEALAALGAVPVSGDLLDATSLEAGLQGASVVVHAAASLTSAVRYQDHERINVEGTRIALACAARARVKRFVYISAASVVIDGDKPTDGDESLPVVFHRSMPYSATKGLAERLVLEANGPSLFTLALRPPFIWGEGAPAIDRIVETFRAGQFLWIGGGDFAYSVCHVDNLAAAVTRSLDHGLGGHAYFVVDEETTTMKSFFAALVEARGQPATARAAPYWLAALIGRCVGFLFSLLRPRATPPVTLENVRLIGRQLRLSSARAARELGYVPAVSREEGLARLRSGRRAPSLGGAATALALLIALGGALSPALAGATPPTDPTGLWQLFDDKTGQPNGVARVEINDGTLVVRIERPRPGTRPEDKCTKCPPPQTGKPFLGLTVAWGLKRNGESWSGGEILDPDSGDTYRCKMKLQDADTLEVRGYLGIPLLGRTQHWKRTQ
jgi:nucleoside-diphosphate-sugar epimerase/uncharacterized protein (DUF2147 family)